MADDFMSRPFINEMGDDEDYEFMSILQEYDEQFTNNYQSPPQPSPSSSSSHTHPPQIQPQPQQIEKKVEEETPQKLISVKEAFSQPQDGRFAEVFEFDHFNPLQSRCFNILYNKDTNIVVSGKYPNKQTNN